MKVFFSFFVSVLLAALPLAGAETENNTTSTAPGYAVTLYGNEILRIYEPIGTFSAEQRATQITATLKRISKKTTFEASRIISVCHESECLIQYGSLPILAVTENDAHRVHAEDRNEITVPSGYRTNTYTPPPFTVRVSPEDTR